MTLPTALKQTALHLPRLLIGIVLVATGVAKLLDIPGFAEVLSHYQIFDGMLFYTIIAYTLPMIELGIACSLLFRWQERWGILAAAVLHLGFIIVLSVTLMRGLEIDNCGCFGVYLARPLTPGSILEDVVLLLIVLAAWKSWEYRRAHSAV